MSRIGKKPILVPQGVSANLQSRVLNIKGPKGELSLTVPYHVTVTHLENQMTVSVEDEEDAKAEAEESDESEEDAEAPVPSKSINPDDPKLLRLTVHRPDGTRRVYSEASHGVSWRILARNHAKHVGGLLK